MRVAALLVLMTVSGCMCAELPSARFRCEPDGGCGQEGFVCFADNFCRMPIASDGGSDAGPSDAGMNDAGFDAGEVDSGIDAGELDAGDDAGFDAGDMDSGVDAGDLDAGMDAGTDAGTDAGADAGMDAGMDAGVDAGCMPSGSIDEPDSLGLDEDCDGFDGDLTRAVFVDQTGGNDGNAGTRASPLQTFAAALASGKTQIYLSTGTFASANVTTAVAVFGGYTPSGAWPRTSTHSVLNGSLTAQPADAGRVVFDRLDVNGDAGVAAGEASVALRLISAAASSQLRDLHLTASVGANGSAGAPAPASANGNQGTDGVAGDLGAQAGVGGAGANCGDAGSSSVGFDGGSGATVLPGDGVNGDDLASGGAGGLAVVCDGGTCTANAGVVGGPGANGMMSTVRPADPPSTFLGSVVANQWRGATLVTWTPAQPGHPGGGGGGGGGIIDLAMALAARGGGAGGGGSGGCGARSGGAGGPGGASIALLLINSSPTLRNVVLTTTQGGRGGDGAAAGTPGMGGVGGLGGAGETAPLGTAGAGATGGLGGTGGPGRQGPGGWGGPIIGVFCSGTSAPSIDGTTTWQMGTPGVAGNGDPNGLAGGMPATGLSSGCP